LRPADTNSGFAASPGRSRTQAGGGFSPETIAGGRI
jgi:hypothetical protein